jgi:Domain of unknown function (DUF4388)
MDEARRGARVSARFRVAIEGLETTPFLRKGDISATGVYFETDHDVGEVGTVHVLSLVSLDGAASVRVIAHVVRTLRMSDTAGRRISGAAFEFLPESDISAACVRDFVRRVLAYRRPGEEPTVSPRLGARVGRGSGPADATLQELSVRSLVLETSWKIEPGEAVRVDVVAPGMTRRLRLDGRAVRVVSKAGSPRRYDIEVTVQQETKRPLRADSSMAIAAVRLDPKDVEEIVEPDPSGEEDDATRVLDDLLAALILPPEEEPKRARRTHLSGELSRIRLPTLCGLFEMERMTGRLLLATPTGEWRMYFSDGHIFDVEPVARGETRRARIGKLLAAEEGTFEFSVESVDRPDRIGTGTTALLLDLAREADESR